MIHLITAENRHLYTEAMLDHFRIRHDIYVRERKWKELERDDGLERDQFDDNDAIYLLAMENKRVVGGSRMRPTSKPHLLSEVFAHLAEPHEFPSAPDIYEWTRLFIIDGRRTGWRNGSLTSQVVCGGIEYLVEEGVSAFTLLCETWWIPWFHEMGWKVSPLGLPSFIENDWWVAAMVDVDFKMLESTRRYCELPNRPLLVRNGLANPALTRRSA